jgi:hypothetical protein
MKATISSIALLVILIADAESQELKSGLRPGDLATPFEVKDVTGPNKGITLCYR